MKTKAVGLEGQNYFHPSAFILHPSLSFLMISVLAATATELAELKPIRRGLFILGRYVVAALANITLKNNVIARHLAISDFRLPISSLVFTPVFIPIGNPQLEIGKNLSFQISDLKFEI